MTHHHGFHPFGGRVSRHFVDAVSIRSVAGSRQDFEADQGLDAAPVAGRCILELSVLDYGVLPQVA